MDPIEQFRDAMQSAGLTPPSEITADGKLHRFSTSDKPKDDAGWYVLHLDGIPAGCFGDWRTGHKQKWRANIGHTLTRSEEQAYRARKETMRKERERDDARRRKRAKAKAVAIWNKATAAPDDHPYLSRKAVKAHGLRLSGAMLVVPMRDGGELHSLQYITPDGSKRFLRDGRVKGCYFMIGNFSGVGVLCIAEGLATGATIHEATGYPVAVAFNAGNLGPAVRALRAEFPDSILILCADDDV